MTTLSKFCKECDIEKPVIEFNYCPKCVDGFSNRCKSCTTKKRRATELELIRKKISL